MKLLARLVLIKVLKVFNSIGFISGEVSHSYMIDDDLLTRYFYL